MKKNKKEWLTEELFRWVSENGGKSPCRDNMKNEDGYPSSHQYEKVFQTRKWNKILIEVGLNPNLTFWTSKEERLLKENWVEHTDEELASLLNKKVGGVRYKRVELGLFRQSRKQVWKDWENNFLIENFSEGEQEWICDVLANRKWETIRAYATKNLRLKRKNKLHLYQVGDGNRLCKECEKVFPESSEYFYKDGDGFRTRCIECYNVKQERVARNKGVFTRKLKEEKFEEGVARCSGCSSYKSIYQFRNNHKDLKQLHRYCIDCEKEYLRIYHLKSTYGENYKEMYLEKNQHLFDLKGQKWDSVIEKDIANWLINNNFIFERGPDYNKVFKDDNSKRKFDWIVYNCGKTYLIEYFGLWDTTNENERSVKYVNKAKKKIEIMYQNREDFNFIIIFPVDLKNKKLLDIFSKKTF